MLRILFKIILCTGLTYFIWHICIAFDPRYGAIGVAFVAPLWGKLFASEFVLLFSEIRYRARWSVLRDWQGHYYQFDGVHLRFYLVDEVIWIALKELESLITPTLEQRERRLLGEQLATIPFCKEIGISETGLLRVLELRTENRHASYQMIRFKRWLINETFPNLRRLPKSAAR